MAATKIRYIGPSRSTDIRLADGREVRVERNHQVEIDTDVARSLLEQADNWQKVTPKKKPKSGAAAGAADEPEEDDEESEADNAEDETPSDENQEG